jgi:hypothetical protein
MISHSYKRLFQISFIVLISFLVTPSGSVAQYRIKNRRVLWSVTIYKPDRRFLEVIIDTRPGDMIARNVRYDVNFYDATNTLMRRLTFTFTQPSEEIAPHKYVTYVSNPYPGANSVKGGKIHYTVRTVGTFYNCAGVNCGSGAESRELEDSVSERNYLGEFYDSYPNVVRMAPGTYRPEGGYDWVNDEPDDFRVRLLPGLARTSEGKLRPANGYEWTNSEPDDFRVRLLPGLVRTSEGKLRPANGYEWINNDPDDLRMRLMPGLVRTGEGKLRPANGYTWIDPASETDLRVRRVP